MAARLLLKGRNLRHLDVPLVAATEDSGKGRFHRRKRDAILWSGRTGETGGDRREVEIDDVGVLALLVGSQVKKTVGPGVGLGDIGLEPAVGKAEIVDGPVVDREETEGGAEFRGHVGDRGPIGDREVGQSGTEEFDEFFDNMVLPQMLGEGENDVGGGDPGIRPALEPDPDDFGDRHRIRLTEHDRLGLDAADPPGHDADAVDHRGVRVEADDGVRVEQDVVFPLFGDDHPAEVFEVDLVADPRVRGDHAEVGEILLRPLQQGVALAVAFIFPGDVVGEAVDGAGKIDLDAVIDDQLHRHLGVDPSWVPAESADGIAHRGEIDHRRHTGKVLHQHPCRVIGYFHRLPVGFPPVGNRRQVLVGDDDAVMPAQQVFDEDTDREGQPVDTAETEAG